ncbi:MAG: hypothetical protein VX593_03820 [Pseudomonadota bacterium]|jgi:flagellar motility protein MotE (MotC chaperone)|nr:hypothetical protein [Pseudomonadota bacterium]
MAAGNARTHVLLTLGVLFTIGGASRILPSTFAIAEDKTAAASAELDADALQASYVPADTDAADAVDKICLTGETAEALAKDQEALDVRVEAIQEQELSLQARKIDLDQRAEELQALQKTLEDRWRQMSAEADQDVEHLAQMYAAMKPDQAAPIFNQMDPGFAAGFLRLMQSDQAGMILASMDSSKAYIVSVKLASLNDDIRAAQ